MHVDSAALKQQAQVRLREFETRRETVLMLAWEAISTEDGGADVELDPTVRRRRFARAKARAREVEEMAAKARAQAAAEKRDEDARKKRAQIAREQARRREWEELIRPRWSPSEPEADDDYEFGG